MTICAYTEECLDDIGYPCGCAEPSASIVAAQKPTEAPVIKAESTRDTAIAQREPSLRGHPIYQTWQSMLGRCRNKNNPAYDRYGGRGIAVCERWTVFKNFLADMGERPDDLSIDRIDNSKGYEPSNCRWATPIQQGRNRRNNVLYDYDGKRMSIAELSETLGVKVTTIRGRLRRGWPMVDVVFAPPQSRKNRPSRLGVGNA
jgi:hypothetical protein